VRTAIKETFCILFTAIVIFLESAREMTLPR
jgi:hypothetical protein